MAKVFLTGASGYLGSTFLLHVPNDWDIIAYSRSEPKIRLPNNIKFVRGDISHELPSSLLADVDVVLHLAAVKGTHQVAGGIENATETNILGTRRLLQNALRNKVSRFLFASTYWVYGSAPLPYLEDVTPQPNESYGLTKLESEKDIFASGLNCTIFRFTNIFGFGSGIRPEEVVFTFIKAAFENKPIILHNNGLQKIDLIDIEDVCSCILSIINNRSSSSEIFNVGSGNPTSIANLASIVKEIFESKYQKEVIANRAGDLQTKVTDRYVSISKLKKTIGEFNCKPLYTSIEEYIDLYEKNLSR